MLCARPYVAAEPLEKRVSKALMGCGCGMLLLGIAAGLVLILIAIAVS